MSLDGWNALSSIERDERREHWISHIPVGVDPASEPVEWRDLVMEAERRFAAIYGQHPEILLIGSSCSFDDQNPVALLIRTRLPAHQQLQEIPSAFLSFPVRQEPVGDDVAAFKDTWTTVLSRLFGWPDEAIRSWIDQRESLFRNPWFLHDPPCDFLPAGELARSLVGPRDESELRMIGKELLGVIGGQFYVDQEPADNWQEARQRIASVIDKHRSR